jgi:hypothetical protein
VAPSEPFRRRPEKVFATFSAAQLAAIAAYATDLPELVTLARQEATCLERAFRRMRQQDVSSPEG